MGPLDRRSAYRSTVDRPWDGSTRITYPMFCRGMGERRRRLTPALRGRLPQCGDHVAMKGKQGLTWDSPAIGEAGKMRKKLFSVNTRADSGRGSHVSERVHLDQDPGSRTEDRSTDH